ncbi:hypothetical protein Tco_0758130 [Tanacetum coccineum]
MAQENYVEGCSMQRPPLLEPNGFCFSKARFKTCVKSKDIDLWQVIQNGDFYYEVEESKTKLMKETPYELLGDDQKKKLGKNKEVKMTLYNALPLKNCKIDLITQEYEKFSISNEKTIDSSFIRLNAIRAKVTAIEKAKDLNTLPLDELIGNLKVYGTILEGDGVSSKPIKEKVMPIALKANITRGQTSSISTCQEESDEDEEINLMAKNFGKLFQKGVKKHNKFYICKEKTKGGVSSRRESGCYSCSNKNHLIGNCPNPKRNKAFIGVDWSELCQ